MLKLAVDSYEQAKDCPLRNVKHFLKWTVEAFPEIKRAREVFDRSQARSAGDETI